MQTPYKFVVSGSGSIELKEKVHESLAGRKRMFELQTVSLKEFINYKTMYKYEDRLDEYFRIEKTERLGLLIEYIPFFLAEFQIYPVQKCSLCIEMGGIAFKVKAQKKGLFILFFKIILNLKHEGCLTCLSRPYNQR